MLLVWLYAAVKGLSLGGIFLVFTGESIARVCFGGDLRRDESLRQYDRIQIFLALDRSS
jgi:hypothetical protein